MPAITLVERLVERTIKHAPKIMPVPVIIVIARSWGGWHHAGQRLEEVEEIMPCMVLELLLFVYLKSILRLMNLPVVIVIPARMASTRFPNKPLAKIAGITMIERVWRIAQKVSCATDVVVATDDPKLFDFVGSFGGKCVMTSKDCVSGTDRVAEAAHQFDPNAVFFNLQGDAPLTPPWVIEAVLNEMLQDPTIQVATPMVELKGKALEHFVLQKQGGSSTGTTVVFNKNKEALYFSKALIPYGRKERVVFRHIGLYGYRFAALQKLAQLPEGDFERIEQLEQLRALENGIPIRVVAVDYQNRTHGSVDRPEDILYIEEIVAKEGELI